jgi:membrane protein
VAHFTRKIVSQYVTNNNPAAAAAIAFYALFALAPTLVFAIAVTSGVLGNAAARQSISIWQQNLIGSGESLKLLQIIDSTSFVQHGFVAMIISRLVLLWVSSTAFV